MHTHGWHAIQNICCQAGIDGSGINATNQRARISTIYASMDIEPSKRALFYSHMGHSAEVNAGTYQRPAAVQSIEHVGHHLQVIDKGIYYSLLIKFHYCSNCLIFQVSLVLRMMEVFLLDMALKPLTKV